jgi:hypothetical protein
LRKRASSAGRGVSRLVRRARADDMSKRACSTIRSSGRSNWRIGIELDAVSLIGVPNVDRTGLEATDSGIR